MERVWDRYLSEQDRAYSELAPAPRKGMGSRPALLLVDLYRGAFGDEPEPLLESVRLWPSSCGLAGWDALPSIQRLLGEARQLGIPVIHVSSSEAMPGWRSEFPRGGQRVMDDAERQRQRRQYEIIEDVAPIDGEAVLGKTGPSAFFGTPLAALLTQLRVDTIVVAGETTSGCVRATVVDGRSHRFRVLVPEPCVFDRQEAPHALNLYDMDQKYADVLSLDEVLGYLRTVGSEPA